MRGEDVKVIVRPSLRTPAHWTRRSQDRRGDFELENGSLCSSLSGSFCNSLGGGFCNPLSSSLRNSLSSSL